MVTPISFLKGNNMSNVLIQTAVIASIKTAYTARYDSENATGKVFGEAMDALKKDVSWRELVSPTPANVANGLSIASKESWKQIRELFEAILKGKGRAHASTDIGGAITDFKCQMMQRQDAALFEETSGRTTDIEKVDDKGKAKIKAKAKTSTAKKFNNMLDSAMSFLEKAENKKALSRKRKGTTETDYKVYKKALQEALKTSGFTV